ncbi:alkene reductase [Rhodovibrio sodomensis]|uniref:Alkene reductase n=1 Tax=Rhodovibrio sodomensis TaxID=1088 RepID=A0ABS1DAN3_9PROT|nr:alkene reductase [Rhodovibrio sodomensis]MBK1667501.1 alkene reductase [Rhodovibrio sodomensis]
MTTPKLFTPTEVGDIQVPNRVVMAPLTRNRARSETNEPFDLHAAYYSQRASAGLIITEATQISPEGKGYAWTPGIHAQRQIDGWRQVTDAVHTAGGRIVLQLWHVGRISHTSLQPDGAAPVGPTAVAASAYTFDGNGFVETSTPRALATDEIARVVEDYRSAARNAWDAGFDGVEVHAANGYLLDQFLRDHPNQRTDRYGGPIENRVRILREVFEAVTDVWPAGRVGVRFSPFSNFNDVADSTPMETFGTAVDVANGFGLGYLHLVEGETGGSRDLPEGASYAALRQRFDGAYMANNGYDRQMAIDAVERGAADLIAFGRPYIANPDLVERLRLNAPLNTPDRDTFYGGGAEGYTDYPFLTADQAA